MLSWSWVGAVLISHLSSLRLLENPSPSLAPVVGQEELRVSLAVLSAVSQSLALLLIEILVSSYGVGQTKKKKKEQKRITKNGRPIMERAVTYPCGVPAKFVARL